MRLSFSSSASQFSHIVEADEFSFFSSPAFIISSPLIFAALSLRFFEYLLSSSYFFADIFHFQLSAISSPPIPFSSSSSFLTVFIEDISSFSSFALLRFD
jgi:hypothetical protein